MLVITGEGPHLRAGGKCQVDACPGAAVAKDHKVSALTQHKRLLLAFSGSESGVGLLGLKSGCQQGWFPLQALGRICFLPFLAPRGAHFLWLVAPPPSLKPAVTSSVVFVVPSLWFWLFGLPLSHCRTLVRTVGPSDDPEESLYLRSADEQQPESTCSLDSPLLGNVTCSFWEQDDYRNF